jgi:isoquinoline 1-oxidoreductase subunit alpha
MDSVTLFVNGLEREVSAPPQQSLLWVLRDVLELTGTKYGCGEGQCGACTVLLEGKAVRSCVTPLSAAAGKKVTTIEGLASNGSLHPVQQSFLREEALQCGYCTSGMILSAVALLSTDPSPSDEAIMKAMNGNICRCGTYPRIVAAVRDAAQIAQKAK